MRASGCATRSIRLLAAKLDVADVARIRDRHRLHALVDATAHPVYERFAATVADDVAREFARSTGAHPAIRPIESIAARFGGEAGSGAWARDLAVGLRSTIVFEGIGGPTGTLVHAIAAQVAAHPPGAYMKRELVRDLRERFAPALERDVERFVAGLAHRLRGAYDDLAVALEEERILARAESIEPIERAMAGDPESRAAPRRGLESAQTTLAELRDRLLRLRASIGEAERSSSPYPSVGAANEEPVITFDAQGYERGLHPQRYRVVVMGALRRGKTSLINALAGSRILHDDGSIETRFPIHVRYGASERASKLQSDGTWDEIPLDQAMAQAARTPVLIETPWSFPRQLVLVHAPAFDSGDDDAERISLAASQEASEVVALFSRQLSDRELDVYVRVAAQKRPILFAHSIADNENTSERRSVVELARRYLQEHRIPTARVFTVSALDAFEAEASGRATPPPGTSSTRCARPSPPMPKRTWSVSPNASVPSSVARKERRRRRPHPKSAPDRTSAAPWSVSSAEAPLDALGSRDVVVGPEPSEGEAHRFQSGVAGDRRRHHASWSCRR